MIRRDNPTPQISDLFQNAASTHQKSATKQSVSPFPLRLTAGEREYLKQQAGGKPLGTYIRERLLGDQAEKRRFARRPKVDEQQIAQVLAELGRSRLSSNLNQLAKSVNMGTLDVSRDIEQELQDACGAVLADSVVELLNACIFRKFYSISSLYIASSSRYLSRTMLV